MSLTITETVRGYEIDTHGYSEQKVKDIGAIDGARWYRDKRVWFVPAWRKDQVNKLKDKYGIITEPVLQMPEITGQVPALPELKISIPLLKKPFPFQNPGIAFGIENRKYICGDQQGLGKTLQAIGTAIGLQCKCILVVCPSTLKLNWKKEWKEVAGIDSMILDDRTKNSWTTFYEVGIFKVFIVNYESLKKYFVKPGWSKPKGKGVQFKMKDIPFRECINLFDCIIIDESTKCKDGTKQQTKLVLGITKGKETVIELTGTPVLNKPIDLLTQLAIIEKLHLVVNHIPQPRNADTGKLEDFMGYRRFLNRYCDGGNGSKNLKELNYRMQSLGIFYRREKHEVLKDLPEKIRQVILCEITNREEYTRAHKEFKDYLKKLFSGTDEQFKKKMRGEALLRIGVLKQLSARGKIEAAIEQIDEAIEAGEKIIVFGHLKEITGALKEKYNALSIIGSDSMEDRQKAIELFQKDPSKNVIVCSLTAAGMGVTLTEATRVLFIEFPWTYALCEQAEDRAHRIGQVNSVNCMYLLGDNTIDRYCYDLIQTKKSIHRQVTDSTEEIDEQVIDQLYNLFNQI